MEKENKKIIRLKNIYFCVIFPAMIGGLIAVGFYYFGTQLTLGFYPEAFILFLSGASAWMIGSLVRARFKWRK